MYYAATLNKLYVTNAGSGECDVYDGSSFRLLRQIDLGGDADNIHPDLLSSLLFVSAGNAVSVVDTARDARLAVISLPGHPEGFALEEHGSRVFINVPLPSKSVFVVDRAKGAQVSRWSVGGPLANIFSNFPISLDEAHQRLPTAAGARTSLWVPELDRLYVAVPHRGNQQAEIRIFAAE